MHRTEGANHINNKFADGPPGTCVEQDWLNAIQEEICNVIEKNGIVLKTAITETTRDQLYEAIGEMIGSMISAESSVPTGSKMLFYQDAAPTGWTLDATLNDKMVYVTKGSGAGGQVGGGGHTTGTWVLSGITVSSHDHTLLGHTHARGVIGGANTGFVMGEYRTGGPSTPNTSSTSPSAGGDGSWRPAAYCCIVCTRNA